MKRLQILRTAATLLLIAIPLLTHAEPATIAGKVVDIRNEPLVGVHITVRDTHKVTFTDMDGEFSLVAGIGDTLVFSYIGFVTREVKVTSLHMNIIMSDNSHTLDEVVVTALGVKRKSHISGSISTVSSSPARNSRRKRQESAYSYEESVSQASIAINPSTPHYDMYYPGGEEYGQFRENRFIPVGKDPLSTFSLDVDAASYSNVRRMINQGRKPIESAVRIEEMVNYFSYDYGKPTGEHPMKINYQVGDCPWNTAHKLVSIGIKAREIPSGNLPPTNFVFLIDTSGSMSGRIELVKSSFKLLVNNLRPDDKVAIVAYASEVGVKLPATPGSDKQKICEAIDALLAYGSTNGGQGIQTAYKVARENFIEGGNNRIILATDGDFNVGVTSPQELEKLIVKERESGIFLTVLGYGMGNYKDERIQTLAEKGNGNHAYIDNMQEAHKVLVEEFGGTMHTVAKDVKLQVEFNPARVQAYRLVGYESRLLEHEDFNDDTVDAAELGVGHTVTALYEIVPVGVESTYAGKIDELKYQPELTNIDTTPSDHPDELLTVKLRYKDPDGEKSNLLEVAVKDGGPTPSGDFYFASAVAMFGQLLKDSQFKGDADYDLVVKTAKKGLGNDEHGYRREFIRLARAAKGLGN
ncbi:MAG: von Willebrand factor type A domain-containing protein [Rikenellaceae bacterium]|nr:von Willebrand factor type A domain-containing protein [Rikenellaceae bacterium]